jgi:hypothetical protein
MRGNINQLQFPPPGTLNIKTPGIQKLNVQTGAIWYESSACADTSGQTLIVSTRGTSSPYLSFQLVDWANNKVTPLTLGTGWGITGGTVYVNLIGYDSENDKYWIVVRVTGTSSLTIDTLVPLTINADNTIDAGTAVTPPSVSGKAFCLRAAVHSGKIIANYIDTTNFRIDEARVYDISGASWAACAGTNKSAYAANTDAVQANATDEDSTFANGGQSNKTYMTREDGTNEIPCFIEFDFSTESFTDKTGNLPLIAQNVGGLYEGVMAIDPSGNYVIGSSAGRAQGDSHDFYFVYDRANDALIAQIYPDDTSLCAGQFFSGDESNGVLCAFIDDSTRDGFPCPYVNLTSSVGVLCGFESMSGTSGDSIGAKDAFPAWNIDGGGWLNAFGANAMFGFEGHKKWMQPFSTSLEAFMLNFPGVNVQVPDSPPKIVYTTN